MTNPTQDPKNFSDYPAAMEDLLRITVQMGGSDLHIAAGIKPQARVHGELNELDYPIAKPADIQELLMQIMDEKQMQQFEEERELDTSYSMVNVARFRVNMMYQRGSMSAVFRAVPYEVPHFDKLGLPDAIRNLCDLTRGLVLVTGPTGSGKSTTLAAMINIINEERAESIVTVEDPIEFLHKHKKSIVRQREVGIDTASFPQALRHVLRQDPDIILIGEMRDLESIAIALTAAETGHLVFSTLHTQTAPLTISRIVDVFTDQRRDLVRQQLANSLRGVISQQLLPTVDGKGRIAAIEFMSDTMGIRNMIREGKEHQLYSAIQTGQSIGMQTMDQALATMVKSGKVVKEIAMEYAVDQVELERLLQRASGTGAAAGGSGAKGWKR